MKRLLALLATLLLAGSVHAARQSIPEARIGDLQLKAFNSCSDTAVAATVSVGVNCNQVTFTGTGTTIDTINTCDSTVDGRPLFVVCGADASVIGDSTGNVELDSTFTCAVNNVLSLLCTGSSWIELGRTAGAGGGGSGWMDDGTIVRLTTAGDEVVIGSATAETFDYTAGAGVVPASLSITGGSNDQSGIIIQMPTASAGGPAIYVLDNATSAEVFGVYNNGHIEMVAFCEVDGVKTTFANCDTITGHSFAMNTSGELEVQAVRDVDNTLWEIDTGGEGRFFTVKVSQTTPEVIWDDNNPFSGDNRDFTIEIIETAENLTDVFFKIDADGGSNETNRTIMEFDSVVAAEVDVEFGDPGDASISVQDFTIDMVAAGVFSITGQTGGNASFLVDALAIGFAEMNVLTAVDGTGVSTGNNSGMESSGSDALALLQGCADNRILKWDEAASTWNCEADADSGGAPAWSAIVAPAAETDLALTMDDETTTFTWNSAPTQTADDYWVFNLEHDSTGGSGDVHLVTLNRSDVANANIVASMLRIQNLETGAGVVTDGIKIETTTAGGIIDGIDVSDTELTNAINVGANPIVSGNVVMTIGDSTTDSITLTTDGTGVGELTLPADSVELTVDTSGNYTATIADFGNVTISVVNGSTEGGAVTLDAIDLNCSNCLDGDELDETANYIWTGQHDFDTAEILSANALRFEGATDNNIYNIFAFTDPTSSSKTTTFQDATGTVPVDATAYTDLDGAGLVPSGAALTVGDGIGITVNANDVDFAPAEVTAVIWLDNADRAWTFDTAGTSPIISFSSNTVDISTGALQEGGVNVVVESLTLTGGVGLAAIGDLSSNRTITFAPEEVAAVTWLDNADRDWAFDIAAAGTNPEIHFAADEIELDANVQIDDGKELRLLESGGPNYVAIVSGALTANRTCTLEDDSTPFDSCISSSGGMTSWLLDGDNTAPQTISDGNTALIAGGTNGIDTVASATDTVTINFVPAEVGAVTWLDNADRAWTFDIAAAGTNPVISFSASTVDISTGVLQEGGVNVVVDTLTLTGGVGIAAIGDLSANRTITFAPAEVAAVTWLDNADRAWTFDIAAAGTNPVLSFSASTINVSTGALQVAGNVVSDSATSFVGDVSGTIGATVVDSVQANSVALGADTTGFYVLSITDGAGITGGDGGSEGAILTLAATLGTSIDGNTEIDADSIDWTEIDDTMVLDATTTSTQADGVEFSWVPSFTNTGNAWTVDLNVVDDGGADTINAVSIEIISAASGEADLIRGISIIHENGAGTTAMDAGILIDSAELTAALLTDGIRITATGVDEGITDGIDVSHTNLLNAINIGANNIITSASTIASTELDSLDGITQIDGAGLEINSTIVRVGDGVGLTVNANDVAFAPAEVGAVTWLDNADRAWTFDIAAAGTNPVISFSASTVDISTGVLQEGGVNVVVDSLTLTGGVGIAAIGDLSANRTITFDATELTNFTWGDDTTIEHTFNVSETSGDDMVFVFQEVTEGAENTKGFGIDGGDSGTAALANVRKTLHILGPNGVDGGILFETDIADSQGQNGRLSVRNFLTAEEPALMIMMTTATGTNQMFLAGGSGTENAATSMGIFLGDTVIDLEGNEGWRITGLTNDHIAIAGAGATDPYTWGISSGTMLPASSSCLSLDSARLYADANCGNSKAASERYIDLGSAETNFLDSGTIAPAAGNAIVLDTDGDGTNVLNDVLSFQSGGEDFVIPAAREYPTVNGSCLVLNTTNDDWEWSASDCTAGGAAVWDTITAPTASDLTLAMVEFTTAFSWNTATDQAADFFSLQLDHSAAGDTNNPQRLLVLENLAASTLAVDSLLYIDNADAVAVVGGIVFDTTGAGGFTTAIDLSDVGLQVVLDLGANEVEWGGILATDKTECVMLDATGGACDITDGCSQEQIEGTNFDYRTLNFATAADDNASWTFELPDNLASTTADVTFTWHSDNVLCSNEAADDVCWAIQSVGVEHNEVWETATLGAIIGDDSVCTADGDIMETAGPTSLVHGWAPGDRAIVRVFRDVDGGASGCADDRFLADAKLLAVRICYEVGNVHSGEAP